MQDYICKNCGKLITAAEYKKEKEIKDNAMGCGCLIWAIVILCFVSVFLIPIAIILLIMLHKNQPENECPYCSAKNSLIPADSPIAQKILKENYSKEELIKIEEKAAIESTKQKNKIPLGCSITLYIILFYFVLVILIAILDK